MVAACFATLTGCDGRSVWLGDLPVADDAGRAEIGGNAPDAAPDGTGCVRGQVKANEVLWIGDSWILVPSPTLDTRVRDLARRAGAIGPSEGYVSAAAAGAYMSDIARQYDNRQAGAIRVKVLLMDGGTWDTIMDGDSDVVISRVVSTFERHLAKVYDDGTVGHIVYFLCPPLANITGVAALRSPLQAACALSKVPCHFLDLQQVWADHPEYTASGDFFPSETGANVLAEEIWRIMQDNCIAQ
jgi:hypothetical protein